MPRGAFCQSASLTTSAWLSLLPGLPRRTKATQQLTACTALEAQQEHAQACTVSNMGAVSNFNRPAQSLRPRARVDTPFP
eukprot:scaffold80165_cov14-Tisochrysis_lutea.AAC.1